MVRKDRKRLCTTGFFAFQPALVRLEENPFLAAIDLGAFFGVTKVAEDASNLHLVGAGLPFDWFANRFLKQEAAGDGFGEVVGRT